eukprot:tig00020911_g15705.t1
MIASPALSEVKVPTWFFTVSAADTVWVELAIAAKVVRTADEARRLSRIQMNKIVAENPVLAMELFTRRWQTFLKEILNHPSAPIGKIKDFFWRYECQARGSLHVHALFWALLYMEDLGGVWRDPSDLLKTDDGLVILARVLDWEGGLGSRRDRAGSRRRLFGMCWV